jgi:pimeloyl-ACP methyl ester carboxylesterase
MVSRRVVVVGGVTTVLSGGAAVVGVKGSRWSLHRVGLANSPDRRVPDSGWEVREHTLDSIAMGGAVRWASSVPPAVPTGVIVCLHPRGTDRRYAFDSIHLHDVVAFAEQSFAVVSVDGGAHSYWHARRDGTDAFTMIRDELLPAVDRVIGADLPKAVIGWSMGGYGAILVAERMSSSFRAVVAAGPALWRRFEESADGAFDDEADFKSHDVFAGTAALAAMAVRIDCGNDDGFIGAARAFAAGLPTPNQGVFRDGFHDAAFWRSVAPSQIDTIRQSFAGSA